VPADYVKEQMKVSSRIYILFDRESDTPRAFALVRDSWDIDQGSLELRRSRGRERNLFVSVICGNTYMKHLMATLVHDSRQRGLSSLSLVSLPAVITWYRNNFGLRLAFGGDDEGKRTLQLVAKVTRKQNKHFYKFLKHLDRTRGLYVAKDGGFYMRLVLVN
jgi:hypothetical protein